MSGKYKRSKRPGKVLDVTKLGGGIELRKQSQIAFNFEKAEWVLGLEEFPGDRRLRNNHVNKLLRAMKRGTFRPEQVQIIICTLDGKTFRLNGQHTAWAVTEMPDGTAYEFQLLEYEAQTMEDVRILYAPIDRGAHRTKANVLHSYLAGTDDFRAVSQSVMKVLPAGFALWKWTSYNERKTHDGDDIAYLMKTELLDLTLKVCGVVHPYSSRKDFGHILRGPVMAAIFATCNKAPRIARDFWGPVADGVGIEKGTDPRLKLRNLLMTTAIGTGAGAQSEKKRVTQEVMLRLCINAWNAYRQERDLKILRASERGKRPTVR